MKIDLRKLRGHPDAVLLWVDLLMLGLVTFNLGWMVFNTLFASQWVQAGVAALSPAFHAWYLQDVFPRFLEFDLLFVAVYITELLLRWAWAIHRCTYHRWFFYPFVHWYDVLGCIPVGSFRWLRVLRVVPLALRLQQHGVIDLRDWTIVRVARKYFDVLVEEVSDRVVLQVLDGVTGEIERGNPVVHRIRDEVLRPRRAELEVLLAARLRGSVGHMTASQGDALSAWLESAVADGLANSPDLQRLAGLPLMGEPLSRALDGAIADIARGIAGRLHDDLTGPAGAANSRQVVAALLDGLGAADANPPLAPWVREALLDTISIVKQQVAVQEWKVREASGHYDAPRT